MVLRVLVLMALATRPQVQSTPEPTLPHRLAKWPSLAPMASLLLITPFKLLEAFSSLAATLHTSKLVAIFKSFFRSVLMRTVSF